MADKEKPPVPVAKIPDINRKVRVLTSADVDRVVGELLPLAEKWKEIGTALRLSVLFLTELEKEEKGAKEKLTAVVTRWLGGYSACPSWEVLGEALRAEPVGGEELAGEIDKKYTEELVVTDTSHPLGCGIENCICQKHVTSMRAEYANLSFPYLDWSEEKANLHRTELITKLNVEYREVVADYDLFYTYIWKAIVRKDATAEKLIDYLKKIELFQTFTKIRYPVIPLFHHLMPAFEAAKTLTNVLLVLRDHIDVFSHNVLVDILLNLGGSVRDRRRLDDFRDKYYHFMRRKATLFPRVYTPPAPAGFALVYFSLRKDIDKISLSEVDSFANRLTYNLTITRFTLKLVGLVREKEGVVSYVYQMPSFARNFVFPLTDEQVQSMRTEGICAVSCCSYNLQISEKAPEGVEDETTKFHSDDPKPSEEEAMEVGEEQSAPKVPLYASLPPDSPFRIDASKVPIPSELEKMQERCRGVENYVAILPPTANKALYAAMVLCQHAQTRKDKGQYIKCIILTNTKPRAHEIMEELRQILPSLNIYLFTGTEQDSITIKINLDKDIVMVCTTGKFHQELEAEVVKFATISLFLVDDCQYSMGQTPLESAFHKYIVKKIYRSLKPPVPQIVGITTNPGEHATALDEEAMQKHILKVAGGVDSTLGVLFTEDVYSDMYMPPSSTKPHPKPSLEVKKFQMRDPMKDVIVALQVELRKWENVADILSPHHKWSAEYNKIIQSKLESALASITSMSEGEAPPQLVERVRVLELMQCYAQALKSCVEFGADSALAILRAPTQGGSVSTTKSLLTMAQFESLEAMGRELERLMGQRSALLDAVSELVCKQFTNQAYKSRGVLFVDSLQDAKFLCTEISKSHFLSRPSVVPRCLVASYSTETCAEVEKVEQNSEEDLEKGREGLEAFARGDCSLLLIPYAVESDVVEIENIRSEFDFLARAHKITRREDMIDAEYVVTFMLSKERKSFSSLRQDFDMCRVELGLRTLPTGQALKKKLTRAQEDVMYSHQSRHIFPLNRVKKQKNEVFVDQVQLRCKKCRVYVCHGIEIFSFFVDGGRHCVVPHRDFHTRYDAKPYHAKHKTIKRVNRLKKIFCSNCGAPWGLICHFPSKGCQLPVIKAKHFIFEMDQKYYSIKLWSDALFKLPPITAYPDFHIHGAAEMEV